MSNKTIISLLKKYNFHPQKKLSQNFLKEPSLMDKMIDALEIYPDEDVLEIGSGLGVLSEKMARGALEVIGVEKDKRLIAIAQKEFCAKENLKFIQADFLKVDLSALLKHCHLPIKVIGNIPYHISSPILFKLLENHSLFQFAILTLQKEVADRLIARVGTKDYGLLTIFMGLQTECKKLFDIDPNAFIPSPLVTSTVMKITFLKQSPYLIQNEGLFKKLVKEAFSKRRKTIQNALKSLLKNGRIKPWESLNIDPKLRPEQLSIAQYVNLANHLTLLG